MIDQWFAAWASGKYLWEIAHANCSQKEKEMSKKINLPGIEILRMKCSQRLVEVLSDLSCSGQINSSEIQSLKMININNRIEIEIK